VIEADRPKRARRRGGKSDELDAVRAARQALATAHPALPRTGHNREALRILLATREHAAKTRTATVNLFKALILTGVPEDLRHQFRGRTTRQQARTAQALRARTSQPVSEQHLRHALRQFATQIAAPAPAWQLTTTTSAPCRTLPDRHMVHRCDGKCSKFRMHGARGKISGRKIRNSDQAGEIEG